MKTKFYFLFLIYVFLHFSEKIFAQTPDREWTNVIQSSSTLISRQLLIDSNNNIYSIGEFSQTVDFDMGAQTYNLTAMGNRDIFIAKFNPSGDFIWAKHLGSQNENLTANATLDANDNIVLTGFFIHPTDFNPDSGIFILTPLGFTDAFIVKLDNLGEFVWAKQMGGLFGTCGISSVSTDVLGNIFVTGGFTNTIDFDPDTSSFYMTESSDVNSEINCFVCKLTPLGGFVWVKAVTGHRVEGSTIKVDLRGNVIVGGISEYPARFDTDTGFYWLPVDELLEWGVFAYKLTNEGNFIWVKSIGGNDGHGIFAIATDTEGSVYSTGLIRSYYPGSDFDPGLDTFNLTFNGYYGTFISKLDSSGNFKWAKILNSSTNHQVRGITVDSNKNVYSTGFFQNNTEFMPGSLSAINMVAKGGEDGFITKLDSNGVFKWAKQIGGVYFDGCASVASKGNSTYFSGEFNSPVEGLDSNIFTIPGTTYHLFLIKLSCLSRSTINPFICDTVYISPSGSHFWTTSGTYFDTIPNSAGCDSIITINLTINQSNSSSQNITSCNSYTSPSGLYNWASSGTYNDTIPNTAGCDSIITINLTIINSSSSAQNITRCNSYNSPSGLFNWTSSGTYHDTIPNSVGCDSIITINLTINNSSSASQTIAACHYFVSPSGNSIWTNSGTYVDTIPNALGCDSIITTILSINDNENTITQSGCDSLTFNGQKYTSSGTYSQAFTNSAGCDSTLFLNLTIYQSSPQTFQQSACDSMEWDGQVYYASGTYLHPHSNAAGCDSTVTLDLTITSSSSSSLSETACSNFTLNGIMYTSSGSYIQTVPNTAGCDSTITLQLTLNSTSSSITQTACDSIVVNGQKYTTSGVFTQTLTNTVSCDSVLTLNLTINHGSTLNSSITACKSYFVNGNTYTTSGLYHLPFVNAGGCASLLHLNLNITQPDTSITQNSNVLSSNASGVTYQWLDCANGYQTISGANAKNYTALSNGNYAVAVTKNSCSDTSACYSVLSIGIDGNFTFEKNISIYPNPSSNGIFMLDCGLSVTTHVALEIYNMLGAVVYTKNTFQIFKGKQILDLSALPSGSYFAAVKTGNEKKMIRLVIQ